MATLHWFFLFLVVCDVQLCLFLGRNFYCMCIVHLYAVVSLFSESLFSLCWPTQKDQSKLHCCPSLKLPAKIACRDSYLGQDHKTFKDCIPPSLSCSVDCYLIRASPTCACLLFVCLFFTFHTWCHWNGKARICLFVLFTFNFCVFDN